jgi:hypothetical protein
MTNKRLNGTSVYLAGGMDRIPDGGIGWRLAITPFLENLGIRVFDPCQSPVVGFNELATQEQRKQWKKDGEYDLLTQDMKIIRHYDFSMVDESRFIIVNWGGYTCGTQDETFLSERLKKPVIVYCQDGKAQMPDWMFAVSDHRLFFDTWDEVKSYITHIHTDPVIDDLGRWIFFTE